jgi:uncharacterized protein YjiS (DUF1127 family)
MATDLFRSIELGREPVRTTKQPSLMAIIGLVETWIDRRRQRRALAELSDSALKDIGLSRGEAYRECSKPFWRV